MYACIFQNIVFASIGGLEAADAARLADAPLRDRRALGDAMAGLRMPELHPLRRRAAPRSARQQRDGEDPAKPPV